MNLLFKKNTIYILSFTILLFAVFYYCYSYYSNYNSYRNEMLPNSMNYEENYISCRNNGVALDSQDSCEKIMIEYENNYDLFYHFSNSIHEGSQFFPFFSFIFIMIPSVFLFVQKTKKGNVKNQLVRQSYHSFLKKEYKESIKSCFILPAVLVMFLLIAGLYTSFKISNPQTYQYYDISIFENVIGSQFLFFIILLITFFIQSVFFMNVAYSVSYYCKNLLFTFFSCVVTFFLIELGLECIYAILHMIFGDKFMDMSVIMLTAIWNYDGVYNVIIPLIINSIYAILSFYIMCRIYNSKEKMVTKCE